MDDPNRMNFWEFLDNNLSGLGFFILILILIYCYANGIETP